MKRAIYSVTKAANTAYEKTKKNQKPETLDESVKQKLVEQSMICYSFASPMWLALDLAGAGVWVT